MKTLFAILVLCISPWALCQESIEAKASSTEDRFANMDLPEGLQFQAYVRTEPRPLKIYRLDYDLKSRALELAVAVGKDPDGEGPAETELSPPKALAKSENFVVAVNTNAWEMLPDPQTGKRPGYIAGGKAEILGWVASGWRTASLPQPGIWSFWLEPSGIPAIGDFDSQKRVKQPIDQQDKDKAVTVAVSGFGGILKDGQVLPAPSDVLHPRTSIGISADKSKITLVVVDGRQPKVSEGVSEEELARLMLEFGCHDAINLDGGGSSILLARQKSGDLRITNRPSEITGARPIPVMIGVRLRQ
jgi:hypothetical protein